jgi:hypothetical protein
MGKIEFCTVEIEETIRALVDYFSRLKDDPTLTKKKRDKFNKWVGTLEILLKRISLFENHALPLITGDIGSFRNRNLILTAMMQRGMGNTFSKIKTHFEKDPHYPVSQDDLDLLIATPDTAASLAWVGDTAIKYAFLFSIREMGLTPEQLHNRRKDLETNKNLSERCDRWELYRYRFYQDSAEPQEKKLEKIKGTFTEAIFGVIFVERNIEGVQKTMHLIDPAMKRVR